jgi:predicted house-cleaning noncanonical NTP pyrophosphatase (MazG superfamily)
MEKLIRDNIKGTEDIRYQVTEDEGYELLKAKLLEEVQELLETDCLDEEEYADVFEVLFELMDRNGIDKEDVEKEMIWKQEEKGGFKENFVIELYNERIQF